MSGPGDQVGVASSNVTPLNPERFTFDAMLDGWKSQQLSRGLGDSTILQRTRSIQRFKEFTGAYPWEWDPKDVEDFTSQLASGENPLSRSTLRSYHVTIRLFCAYISDKRYEWATKCDQLFGQSPSQICHEWNTRAHISEYEGKPARRPFTYAELQAFFDCADGRVGSHRDSGKKGALAAYRDAQMFKTAYAFGLRRAELVGLDLHDLHFNPSMPQWKELGSLHVRFGKSSRGGSPRRRSVLAVPEFEWAIEGLRAWLDQVRPKFHVEDSDALWITERHTRVSMRYLDLKFAEIRSQCGLPPELSLHSLRHSYVTHLVEYGYAERFVQVQVGHSYASTTAIYTSVSDDFMNRSIRRAFASMTDTEEEGKGKKL